MKNFCHVLASLFILIAPVQHIYSSNQASWDSVSDQQIKSCMTFDTFQNILLLYSYEHRNWELRIIFNPNQEQIQLSNGQPSMFQFYYGVFSRDMIPKYLQNHLRDIIKNQLGITSGGHWGIASTCNGTSLFDYFAGAIAVQVTGRARSGIKNGVSKEGEETLRLNVIKNPDVDAEIETFFASNELAKKSLCYELDGYLYQVLLIHNPEELDLKSTLGFHTLENGYLRYTVTWNSKFGIFVDKEAPQELIDHIAGLCGLSRWNRYCNLSIHNGDKKSFIRYKGHWEYTYTPYSWYTWMTNPKP